MCVCVCAYVFACVCMCGCLCVCVCVHGCMFAGALRHRGATQAARPPAPPHGPVSIPALGSPLFPPLGFRPGRSHGRGVRASQALVFQAPHASLRSGGRPLRRLFRLRPPRISAAAGATPHGPAESSPTEDSRHPQGSPTLSQAWGYGLLAEPLCREPDFNVIDGLSHSKDKPVSLLKNARLIADASGRPRLLLPLPSCSMLSAQASYWILVNFQVCARALVPGLGCGSLRRGADLLRSWAGVWRGGRRQSLIIHEYARGSKKRGRKSSSSPRATCAPAENTPSSRRHW